MNEDFSEIKADISDLREEIKQLKELGNFKLGLKKAFNYVFPKKGEEDKSIFHIPWLQKFAKFCPFLAALALLGFYVLGYVLYRVITREGHLPYLHMFIGFYQLLWLVYFVLSGVYVISIGLLALIAMRRKRSPLLLLALMPIYPFKQLFILMGLWIFVYYLPYYLFFLPGF